MWLRDTIKIPNGSDERLIELYVGDLTDLSQEEAVDILVVSAFPNDYAPTQTSLIGALNRKGISVAALAKSKAIDLRQTCSCWLSPEIISSNPGIQFKRILCFEPGVRGLPTEIVGDIFRSLAPFLGGSPPVSSVAMPLVACGDMMVPVAQMLEPLLDAAVHWLTAGLPLKRLKIVTYGYYEGKEAVEEFARFKEKYESLPLATKETRGQFTYDLFISYAHKNDAEVTLITEELMRLRPNLRIFHDRMELKAGSAWQHEIFEALDACQKVLAVYSPAYVESKVCKEEFNIAWAWSREAEEDILLPLYLYTAALPTYMKLVQYIDCREGRGEMIAAACQTLVSALG